MQPLAQEPVNYIFGAGQQLTILISTHTFCGELVGKSAINDVKLQNLNVILNVSSKWKPWRHKQIHVVSLQIGECLIDFRVPFTFS